MPKKRAPPSKRRGSAQATPNGNGKPVTSNGAVNGKSVTNGAATNGVNGIISDLDELDLASDARACTGVLSSHPSSRDIKIDNYSLTFHGVELFQDTRVELTCGKRYGLIGPNGCGKSSFLTSLGMREVPVPDHVDIFHLKREIGATDKTALECVMEVDEVRTRLEKEAEELAHLDGQEAEDTLMEIYERLDEMDSENAEVKAARILHGLGFTAPMMQTKTRDFSGGWRMRISLARALFVKPHLLLLDEPTNHLDLEACVWLEEELKNYQRILILISHSQDFLNGVCTNIIHMHQGKLNYYSGNYDSYIKTRTELEENQMKKYNWEQDQIQHMKDYIARFGHGSAKLARQAQSKEKTLGKMVAAGLTQKVFEEKTISFYFPEVTKIAPPVLMVQNVSFKYADDKPHIYKDVEFGLDLDSRIALVGPNGAGKSTLLKLIAGELNPTDGLVRTNTHLKIGRYHQHLQDLLDLDLSALEWMMKNFPEIKEIEVMRRIIGRYGLTGKQQICPIRNLSDGQRCRCIFAWLASQSPHMLLLDEPTNHLDIETIDALADAINDFQGGLVLVSHDFRLINQVAKEIWVCEHQKVTKWTGDILSYKQTLKKHVLKEERKTLKAKTAGNVTVKTATKMTTKNSKTASNATVKTTIKNSRN